MRRPLTLAQVFSWHEVDLELRKLVKDLRSGSCERRVRVFVLDSPFGVTDWLAVPL